MEQIVAVCRPFTVMNSSGKWRQYGIIIVIAIISFSDNIPILLDSNWQTEEYFMSGENTSDVVTNKSAYAVQPPGSLFCLPPI